MFEVAEIGRSLTKEEFKQIEPELRFRLLRLQQTLRESDRSLIIIVAGVEGAGKGEVVDKLNRWFDTRDVRTYAFWDESDEEKERPRLWRYWRCLPARGSIAVIFGSWYEQPIVDLAFDNIGTDHFEAELQRIEDLERSLASDGSIIVKFWFHLPRQEQQNRLSLDEQAKTLRKSPLLDAYSKRYEQLAEASERAIRLTDTGFAPWHIIEATDSNYRDISAGQTLASTLQQTFATDADSETTHKESESTQGDNKLEIQFLNGNARVTVLDNLDLTRSLQDEDYNSQLDAAQRRLYELSWSMHRQKKNAVVVLEGWDAAGKGSAIRRLVTAMDARLYRVIPIGVPTDEELAHHYLWRFWRQIPRSGYMTIYDRSWYGRVLVERVEGLASRREWLRSYQEINNFEENLTNHGTALVKCWIHISPDEQLERFKQRQENVLKQHKITEADWRNREKYKDYKLAVHDMVAHTSTAAAPWTLIPGNDKKYARVETVTAVADALEKILQPSDT